MTDAEQVGAVLAGVVGLVAFAGGSVLAGAPRVDLEVAQAVAELRARRTRILAGAVASVAGASLLLWPLALVASVRSDGGDDAWPSLALASLMAWVFGFGFLALGTLLLVAVVWRPDVPDGAAGPLPGFGPDDRSGTGDRFGSGDRPAPS